MTDIAAAAVRPGQTPGIARLTPERPWAWLAAGWRDLWRTPGTSLAYGFFFSLAGSLMIAAAWTLGLGWAVLPLLLGVTLVGPILAVGIYDASRRLERGERVRLADTLAAFGANRTDILMMGLALMLFLFVWVRFATLLFALFFAAAPPQPEMEALLARALTPDGVAFLAVGTLFGFVLAAVVFACCAISIPMLLDRDVSVVTAVVTSVQAVRRNFWTMALWAWLIALLTAAGVAFAMLGLVVILPLIGHATWHAYRDVVVWPASPAGTGEV